MTDEPRTDCVYWDSIRCGRCSLNGGDDKPLTCRPDCDFYKPQTGKRFKPKPTCPVCGNEVDEPISSEDLEDAHSDRFFEDAIRSEEAEEKEVVPKCEKTVTSYGTVYACVLAKDHDGFHRYSREDLNERD